jgi:hypothetical protein
MTAPASPRQPSSSVTNTARDSAHVDMQIGVVNGSIDYYNVSRDDPPEKKYEIGLRYLNGNMPRKAEELFQDAFGQGYQSTGVAYYWALAVFSGRAYHQLSPNDFDSLQSALRVAETQAADECADAFNVVRRLFNCLTRQEESGDPDPEEFDDVLRSYAKLQEARRDEIRRHLDMILTGWIQDQLDARFADEVGRQRLSGSREKRVWKFFEPVPEPPRPMVPEAPVIGAGQRAAGLGGAVVLAFGLLLLLGLAAGSSGVALASAIVLIVAGGYLAGRCGIAWFAARERLTDREREYGHNRPLTRYSAVRPSVVLPTQTQDEDDDDENEEAKEARRRQTAFLQRVPAYVRIRFAGQAPAKAKDRRGWEADTARLRDALTDRMIELYLEPETEAGGIDWLIRWYAREAARKWQAGELEDYRTQLRLPYGAKLGLAAGVTGLGLGTAIALFAGLTAQPGGAILAAALAAFGCWVIVKSRVDVYLVKRHRLPLDRADAAARLMAEEAEFGSWCEVLADRPTDEEMARWLDYDKMYLKTMVMNQFGLTNRDVLAHAALTQQAHGAGRARVLYGPPRYTGYIVMLFLLTGEGVRQVSVDLDFPTGGMTNQKRNNFRYDAIASVRVTEVGERTAGGRRQVIPLDESNRLSDREMDSLILRQAFCLSLVSGNAISVIIDNFDSEFLDRLREDPSVLLELALDTSGVNAALRIMETAAAEGKQWLAQERDRRMRRVMDHRERLTTGVRSIGAGDIPLEITAAGDDNG